MSINDPKIERFIRQSMVARIATLSQNRRPSITPLYFVVVDGHIWLGTADWTLAAREINTNPRVTVLFQHERSRHDQRILRVQGQAVVRIDDQTVKSGNRQMAFKYVFSPAGLLNHALNLRLLPLMQQYRAQGSAKGKACIIDMTPERVEFLEPIRP